MDAGQLKAVQAPIKDRYRTDPASALVTIESVGELDIKNQHCNIKSFAGMVRAGLHPAAGGNDQDACSAELLLESLVACAGVTFSAVATNMGLEIGSCRIIASGDMDFRGTLGVDREAPVGLTAVRLKFEIESSLESSVLDKLVQLTERYCVIYQTLQRGVPVTTARVAG